MKYISTQLRNRLLFSTLLSVALLLLIYLSFDPIFKPVFALTIATVISLSLYEYYQISAKKGFPPLMEIGIVTGILYSFSIFFSLMYPVTLFLPPLVLGLSLFVSFLYFFYTDESPLVKLAITFFGLVYIAIPLSFTICINYFFPEGALQDGRWWLVYAIAVTKFTDTGAYFSGKLLGKSPLAPEISPKKTREGAIGGLLTAIVISVLLPFIAEMVTHKRVLQISLLESVFLGSILGFVAQIGDLAESLLKRDAGVKDSNQLPGLGGMLDIIDSLIFTIPLVYFFLLVKEWNQKNWITSILEFWSF